jgi:hypothetical protein
MLSLLLCALERVIFSSSKIFVAFVILIRSVIFNSGQKKKKMMTVANGGEEKQEHDVKKEPEEKDQAMMQVDPPPAAAPAPAVEVANATPPLAPPVPRQQQQQQQQQLPQRKMIPNPQDVNKAASIASERALIDAKKAISVRLKFKSKEGGKEDKKKDDFFRTAKDVLETLMPFHAFADQRGLFQFDPSFPSSLMVDDDEDNKNKNARRKKLRLLREAVGMLIAEKEGFSTKEEEEKEKEEDKKDEGEERKANENNENEQKVKRRRLNEAYALLTEENVLRSGFAFRMNRVDDGLLKELRTLHKGLEVCEQSCARLQRHSDEDSTSANVLSKAEEFLIERLVSEETRIVLDAKSSELRKIAQEERQKMADVRKAETAFALASKAAAAAQQQQQIQLRFQQQQQQIQQQQQQIQQQQIQQQQTN